MDRVYSRPDTCKMLVILIFAFIFETTFYSHSLPMENTLVCADSSDFNVTVQTACFVDKTLAIKKFIEGYEMVMITAPRRFGKSTNLDMIKRFCEITVDHKGNRVQPNLTSDYALFTGNDLNVYNCNRVFFENHFGNYPTIYLDFKQLNCSSYESFVDAFKRLISNTFISHKYLLHSCNLDDEEQNEFKQFYYYENITALKDTKLFNSVGSLTRLLYSHFNKTRCIVLIDEFDAPVLKSIFHGGSDVDKIVYLIQKFISNLLKSNPFVERALIHACVRLGGVLTSGANNIKHYPFTETHNFNEYYGLNETEVVHLAERQGIKNPLRAIRKWYDGYRVCGAKFKIYHVFSIVNYLFSKQLENYWAGEDYFFKFEKLCLHDEIYNKLMSVLMYKTIEVVVIHKISMEHIIYLRNLVTNPENLEVDSEDANLFLNFMLDLGYFTILDKYFRTGYEVVYSLTISNRQIREEIRRSMHNFRFLRDKFEAPNSDIQSYIQSILNLGNHNSSYEEFGKAVRKLFKKKGFPKNERQLQNPLFAFPWLYGEKFSLVESEFKTGKGKFIDLLIIRKDSTGIIIELKNRKRSAEVREGQTPHNAALDQIVKTNNTYYEVFNSSKKMKVAVTIFIGLYLNRKGICSLSFLYNSIDISKAVDISIQ